MRAAQRVRIGNRRRPPAFAPSILFAFFIALGHRGPQWHISDSSPPTHPMPSACLLGKHGRLPETKGLRFHSHCKEEGCRLSALNKRFSFGGNLGLRAGRFTPGFQPCRDKVGLAERQSRVPVFALASGYFYRSTRRKERFGDIW